VTLASTTAKTSYAGDDSTVAFTTGFAFQKNADVTVILRSSAGVETTWVEGTQYTLTGAGDAVGGTVTVDTSPTDYTPATGETLVIKRIPTLTQDSSLPLGGPLPSDDVEDALDRLVMITQSLDERLDRALTFASTSTATATTFPDPSASKIPAWNAAGTALVNTAFADISALIDAVFSGLATNDFIQYDGTNWVNKTPAQVATALALGTGDSPQFTAVNIGHATDTTLTRVSAGVLAVEGVTLATVGANSFTGIQSNAAQVRWSKGADIASASPLVLGTDGNYFDVTGTTGFSQITCTAGTPFMLQFDGALVMTDGANLILPNDRAIMTAAGDRGIFFAEAANTPALVGYVKANGNPLWIEETLVIAVSDETTAITTGTAKVTFRMPWALTLYTVANGGVKASLTTASSSGLPAIDINEAGASIFSTTLTIDESEETSTTATTAAVLSDTALADDAEITIDIDTAGTGAAGLKVTLRGYRPG